MLNVMMKIVPLSLQNIFVSQTLNPPHFDARKRAVGKSPFFNHLNNYITKNVGGKTQKNFGEITRNSAENFRQEKYCDENNFGEHFRRGFIAEIFSFNTLFF
jgi:uncharacterized Fe-S cluster-containing radical SAM superfamily protein